MTIQNAYRQQLKEQIEEKRQELSRHIDASEDGEMLYKLSVELDRLISQYMEG